MQFIGNIGSIHSALSSGYIKSQQVLDYLSSVKTVSDDSLIAFSAAMSKNPEVYLSSSEHALTLLNAPEYAALYLMLGGNPDAKKSAIKADVSVDEKSAVKADVSEKEKSAIKADVSVDVSEKENVNIDVSNEPITGLLVAATSRLYKDKKWARKLEIISGVCTEYSNNEEKLLSIHSGHTLEPWPMGLIDNLNWVQIKSSPLIDASIARDSYDYLIKIVGQIPLLVARCETLRESLPDYWKNVAEPIYSKVFTTLAGGKKQEYNEAWINTNMSHVRKLNCLFPNIFESWLTRTDLSHKLWTYPKLIQAYFLGYPFTEGMPASEALERGLSFLAKFGIKEYTGLYMKDCIEKYKNHIPSMFGQLAMPINQENTLTEDPWTYSSVDRILINVDGKVYSFTRDEFEKLLETGKNFYTRTTLNRSIMEELKTRLKIAKDIHLPKAAPLSILLEQMMENKFPGKKTKAPQPSSQAQRVVSGLMDEFSRMGGGANLPVIHIEEDGNAWTIENRPDNQEDEEDLDEEDLYSDDETAEYYRS